jgi:hypothetical protein
VSTATAVPAIAAAISIGGLAAVTIRVWIGRAGEVIHALTADARDPRIDALPPDPTDGLTWDQRWDEEPRPGSGPARREVEL